jgi:hypothetical protein
MRSNARAQLLYSAYNKVNILKYYLVTSQGFTLSQTYL